MRLPNFLVVGAPKAGTTSMHRYLSEHPEIFLPPKKGLHYFTYDYLRKNVNGPGDKEVIAEFCQDLEDYRSHYRDVPSEAIAIGDASPSYLFFDGCIPRIKDVLGEKVKILIMVRNPVDRAFSMYLHLRKAKRETLPFFEALQEEERRADMGWGDAWLYKAHSLYLDKILSYQKAFGENQVKIIVHDDFKRDAAGIMKQVYEFLNVDPHYVPQNINIVYGKTGEYANPLAAFLATRHPLKQTVKNCMPAGLTRLLRNVKDSYIQKKTVKPLVPDEPSVSFLTQYFRHDIAQLEQELHLNVRSWS